MQDKVTNDLAMEKTTPSVLVDERLLPKRFLVVSNRLPYQFRMRGEKLSMRRGIGGLVTAIDPVLQLRGGNWIGWSGCYEQLPQRIPVESRFSKSEDYFLRPIELSRKDVEEYYLGYSNRCLWPLFHYFQEHYRFSRDHWNAYRKVNRRFAEAVVDEYRDGDLVWIHDYHLMLVPAMVREALPQARIGFFLHIPFPGSAVYQIDPHATELLEGLLASDLIGFHVDSYVHNFIDCVSALTNHRFMRSEKTVTVQDRVVQLGSFPISIDCRHFIDLAQGAGMEERIRKIRESYRAEVIALGVDRLDYSKGILERLRAIELMLDRHPDMQGKFTFVQLSAPSRTKVHAYRAMRDKIEQMVGHINGRFGGRGCIPIDYRYAAHEQEELVAFYRASDLALVTPLRDGMNLVAKEYVISRVNAGGALLLSRFAGAFQELREAIAVNPYDPEGMAEAIYHAIQLAPEEKRRRMSKMRSVVLRNDIFWWLERFLRAID